VEPQRRYTFEDKTLGKDFHTKRAWGMAPDELPAQDFEKIMAEE